MSQSLSRALTILGELGEGSKSLEELATRLDVHKSTVLRLLRTMESVTVWARGSSSSPTGRWSTAMSGPWHGRT
jgi:DNA-binding IclR family transcriptional regulator